MTTYHRFRVAKGRRRQIDAVARSGARGGNRRSENQDRDLDTTAGDFLSIGTASASMRALNPRSRRKPLPRQPRRSRLPAQLRPPEYSTARRARARTLEIARVADLVVCNRQAHPLTTCGQGVREFHALVQAGISKDKLAFALQRIGTPTEEAEARAYVTGKPGIRVFRRLSAGSLRPIAKRRIATFS